MSTVERIEALTEDLRDEVAIIAIKGRDGWYMRYINMSDGDSARTLYALADAVVERIPLSSASH